jgi:hypothetical protein
MSKISPQTLKVPKLRFPGFKGAWEEKKLGEVGVFLKGAGISKDGGKTMKKVIFIGGVNGCGKTNLTEELSARFGCLIGKQKRAMIAAATERGMPWEKIPDHYEELIGPTADRLVSTFSENKATIMFIDCHYAFKLKRALKMNIDKVIQETDEPYIQAIDDRVIDRLVKEF